MVITVEVPDQMAKEFSLTKENSSRQLLESFLLQQYAEGKITAHQLGKNLGLGFYATEQFLHDHGAPPNVLPEQQSQDVAALERLIGA